MKHLLFVLRLFVALFARSARCRLAGALVTASAAVLRLSKRVAAPAPSTGAHITTFSAETLLPKTTFIPSELNGSALFPTDPQPATPLTVAELLENADRWNRPVFALRVPGFLIQISKLNDLLERAVDRCGDEGDPDHRHLRPFLASKHRATHDTAHHFEA